MFLNRLDNNLVFYKGVIMLITRLLKTNNKYYVLLKALFIVCLILLSEVFMPTCGDCLGQETADIIASWTNGKSTDGGEFNFQLGINCGDSKQDGRDKVNSTTTYHVSNSGNSIVHFGVTDQVRYPGTHSVLMHTDANILATCNQNNTVERAEISQYDNWRKPGRAQEGNTVWMGWSEMLTDIDESNTATVLQFRSNCGSGSPACEIYMRPKRLLQLRTREIPVYKNLFTVKENVWYDWIVELKYSKTNTGYVKVWVYEAGDSNTYSYSDTPTGQILNNPTMLSTDGCPHLRWGVYRWESGDKKPWAIPEHDRLMTKYIGPARWKFGNDLGAEGFEAVKPRPLTESAIDDNTYPGSEKLPGEYALLQNHPNPFNPATTITFKLPETADATLAVYNQRGRLIRTLHAGLTQAGEHRVVWDGLDDYASHVCSGVYLYRLTAKNFVDTKKLVLIK